MERRGRKCEIDCCIVDDHCDILPFVHAFFRCHKPLLLSNPYIIFVHIDAHPDLSLPSLPALQHSLDDWKDTDLLYELLDSEGGISEFIFPLFASSCIDHMIWLKPPLADQFPPESEEKVINFTIYDEHKGKKRKQPSPKDNATTTSANSASSQRNIYTDYCVPYYVDNNDYKAIDLLKVNNSVEISMNIVQSHSCPVLVPKISKTNDKNRSICYILDICLDYFITNNPFRLELEAYVFDDLQGSSHPTINDVHVEVEGILDVVQSTYKYLSYRQIINQSQCNGLDIYEYKEQCLQFVHELIIQQSQDDEQTILNKINGLYKLNSASKISTRNESQQRFIDSCKKLIEYAPLLSTRTKEYIISTNVLLLLPHTPRAKNSESNNNISEEFKIALKNQFMEIKMFITRFMDSFSEQTEHEKEGLEFNVTPIFISISRSSYSLDKVTTEISISNLDDGYTPGNMVNYIQAELLSFLKQDLFPECNINIHDMQGEPILKADQYLCSRRQQKKST